MIEERPCPKIAEGPGRVVTATITHANDDVRTLTMSSGETLYVTGNHRMFSATAQDWVPVKDLSVGEELQTSRGRESVAALGYQHGRHQVYNVEVEAEHCYFVGTGEVLSHNASGPGCSVTSSAGGESGNGEYKDVGGHHVHAKSGFQEHATYDPDKGFSISQEYMKERDWDHQAMTNKQREEFGKIAKNGTPNTLKEHTRIAVSALEAGGATQTEARGLAAESLRNLRRQNAKQPSKIPWSRKRK